MGIDSMVLVREASPAMRPARFFSSGCAGTMPSTFFWFGQMRNQTLNHMMVPSHMPKPMAVLCALWSPMPSLIALPRQPFIPARMRPVTIVAMAPQRNQNSAVGAMNLVIAGFCSSGILGIDGVCTKLKYQRCPIHMMPLMTCSQRKAIVHQAKLTNSMVSPSAASGDGVDQQDQHNREHEAEHDRALQRVQWILHRFPRGRSIAFFGGGMINAWLNIGNRLRESR